MLPLVIAVMEMEMAMEAMMEMEMVMVAMKEMEMVMMQCCH